VHCDWSILVLLLYSDNLVFTRFKEECKWRSCEQSWKKLEKFWIFWLGFRCTYHSVYDSELELYERLWPSENQKSDSFDSENQPLVESGVLGRGWYSSNTSLQFLSWKFKMPCSKNYGDSVAKRSLALDLQSRGPQVIIRIEEYLCIALEKR